MARTSLQIRADEHAAELRRVLAQDLRRMRDDAGLHQDGHRGARGADPSLITRLESRDIDPTLETYARVAAALGANLTARVYPDTGPSVRDRHQVRAAECLLASLHPRWRATPVAAVRRPVRGWVDARDARRLLAAAYAADPRDALDALTGMAAWPGPALLWARLDGPAATLDPLVVVQSAGGRDAAPSTSGRTSRTPGPGTPQEVASTAASASANGSRFADVKPATLIRPLPTT